MAIHATAIVAPGADLHSTVEVGPYTVVGPNVKIGARTTIGAHCNIEGYTTIGAGNKLYPSVVIGCPPQDLKFSGELSFVRIGDGNHFREFTTVHVAEGEGNATIIGNNNMFMNHVHIAHNCIVGSRTIMSNCTTLAGHVTVGDRAVLGGFTGVHQFCKVGGMVMIGGMTKVVKDVPPYITLDGNPARVIGLNLVGLKRNEVPKESIETIRELFRVFFRSNQNVSQILANKDSLINMSDPFVREFFEFVEGSTRGVYKRTRAKESISERAFEE